MRTYRPNYTVGGVVHQSRRWWLDFHDHQGRRQRLAGFADRRATEAVGRAIDELIWCRTAGQPPEPALLVRIGNLPAKLRASLCSSGLLDGPGGAFRPLLDYLHGTPEQPGYRQHLEASGASTAYVVQAVARTDRIIQGCGFRRWPDISAAKVTAFLHGLRQPQSAGSAAPRQGLGVQSFNGYLRAIKAFCGWLVDEGLAQRSPLTHLATMNDRLERRHDRRALSVDEACRLLTATSAGPVRLGMSGPQRTMLYRLAIETGLRAGELASLTSASFDLDGRPPTVTVEAAYSKRRRRDTVLLRAATAEQLRTFLAPIANGERVFANLPVGRLARMFRADLAAARLEWLDEASAPRGPTDFLCYRDVHGGFRDFHSLRHTCASLLAAAGVHPKVAQVHMRLSTIELTMGRYTHVLAGQQAAALAALPNFSRRASDDAAPAA
jgi:integrase